MMVSETAQASQAPLQLGYLLFTACSHLSIYLFIPVHIISIFIYLLPVYKLFTITVYFSPSLYVTCSHYVHIYL